MQFSVRQIPKSAGSRQLRDAILAGEFYEAKTDDRTAAPNMVTEPIPG
jgi:hypothetical protein